MTDIPATDLVAYLGPAGTYSHAALWKFFSPGQACVPVDDIPAVFRAIAEGDCRYGVVPVENSTEGSITQTLDCLSKYELHICGEVMMRIRHYLLARPDTKIGNIRRIYSHQQSLGQCRDWLETHFTNVEKIAVFSNAEGARKAAAEDDAAAIASITAATTYGLAVIEENIEDNDDNTTRFAVICRKNNRSPSGRDKSSLIISTRNEPGALFNALEPFKNHAVNLIRLESRPSRKQAWSYSFFVDIDGHCDEPNIRAALEELTRHALDFRVLGSYPVAASD